MNSDVVIVGGGIHGCSIAYNLARLGVSVTVLEKDYVSCHASGVNAGGVRLLGRNPKEVPLSHVSMDMWHTLHEELDYETGFKNRSVINIAIDDADMNTLHKRQDMMHGLGYTHEKLLDQKELRERLPYVAPHCIGGVVSERDGWTIPYKSTIAYRHAAIRHGAQFMEGEEAVSIRKIGSTWLVDTEKNHYESEYIINCAGAWGDRIALMIGDNVPLTHSAPMLMVTTRMPHFVSPVVGAVSRPLSFKQFDNGTVLIGGGSKGFADREAGVTRLDYTRLTAAARNVVEFFPIMKNASINRMWSGFEGYMPDSVPALGFSPAADNAFHAFGFSAHGFQLGPIVGKIMADLVTTKECDFDLNNFRPDRFERKVL